MGKKKSAVSRRMALRTLAALGTGSLILPPSVADETDTAIRVPAQTVPVLADADVVVCGAGTAGITAACSAARHGASVVLLERWPCVGGMATAALVNGWHRGDREKMVIYGLVEEAAERARQRGWIKQDGGYPRVHETHWFDPEGMKIVYHRSTTRRAIARPRSSMAFCRPRSSVSPRRRL
jgi:glycine/D-amino acid oxidase-like deaminating enzyme